jgi:DNA repair protein RadD
MSSIPPLRDYQLEAIEQLRAGIRQKHRAQLLVLPTGAGKTTVASKLIHSAIEQGSNVLFMAHRKELVEQAKDRLHQFGVKPGIIMSGWKHRKHQPVNVASVQTLLRRDLPTAKIIIVDEAHHSISAGFKQLLEQYPESIIIGLTATPYRLDGKGLGDIYSKIVAPISLADLTDRGYLVPARYFGSKQDMSDVASKGGDYDPSQMYNKFDKREIYDGVVEHYNKFAAGTKAIVFNVNVEHSVKMTDKFIAAGIPAAHVDGETSPLERNRILQAFRDNKFKVLCNVNILTEGFDLPTIETVILNRATKSKSLYLQMIGRGLRPAPGKSHCTVIDQGGNVWQHGPVDMPEEYTLEAVPPSKRKGAQATPVKECPQCYLLQHLSRPTCEECGYVFRINIAERELKKVEFEEITSLTKILAATVKPSKPPHLRKSYSDMSLEELKEVAQLNGWKPGWAYVQYKRQNKEVA